MIQPTVFDVRRYLEEYLETGDLGPGGRLPTERELSELTGASRRLIRRVLAALEAEGLIWRQQGKGTFAGQPVEPVTALAAKINDTSDPIEVMEARLCIEPEIAALCATRATPDDVLRMWTLARHVYEVEDHEMTELWDSALHRLIAQCAGNRPLLMAFGLLDDTRATESWLDARVSARTNRSLRESHAQHIAIVSAIEAGDAGAAREAMRTHLISRITALSEALGAITVAKEETPDYNQISAHT